MPLIADLSKTHTFTVGAGVTSHVLTLDLDYNEPGGVDLVVAALSADVTEVNYVVLFSHDGGGNTDRKRLWVSDETEGNGLTGSKALGTTSRTQLVLSLDKPPARKMRLELTFTVGADATHSVDTWVYRRDGR